MSKVKVLTVQFDVTDLPQEAICQLRLAAEIQGESFVAQSGKLYRADLLNASVREVETEDN